MAITHLFKLLRVGYVFSREGVFGALDTQDMPLAVRIAMGCARIIERSGKDTESNRLSRAFIRLGPTYIKLGQFLATRKDLVGPHIAAELALLQDKVPALPVEDARAMLKQAFGAQAEVLFPTLEPAVAAASIAQVHKVLVQTREGLAPRAVKLLRPDVTRQSEQDLKTFRWVARKLERWLPSMRRLKPEAVIETLAHSIRRELDLRFEAAALSEIGENTAKDDGFHVPNVDWERTTRAVLTMDWVEGIPLNDLPALEQAGLDLPTLGEKVIQSFLRQAMRDGFFHADMHPGNLFVKPDGTLVAVDFGITGRLDAAQQQFLAEVIHGFIKRDYKRIAQVHFDAGYVPSTESIDDFSTALRAIGEPIQGRSADEISMARLLTQLFEVTELFNMETRPELILMQKTMVVVEGVGRTLNPRLNMWLTAEPVVVEWMQKHLGPAAKIRSGLEDLHQLSRAARQLPALLEKIDTALELNRTLSSLHDERAHLRRSRERSLRWGAAALWAIAVGTTAMALSFYGIIL